MLPSSDFPTSLLTLLACFQSSFSRPTFITFCALVRGFIAQTGARTVCGMLTGSGLAQRWHHARVHRFFSHRHWGISRVGLQLADLVVSRLVSDDAPLELVVDDTLFRRTGRKVFGARYCHDDSAANSHLVGFGNCFVVLGIAVYVPVCKRTMCFPVLCSLWGKSSKILIARDLVERLAARFPERTLHVTGDAAYISRDLRDLPARITWATRPRANAVFHGLTPPRTGKKGRPRLKGDRLPSMTARAGRLHWTCHTVTRYGVTATVAIAHRRLLWYHPLGVQPARLILVRETSSTVGYDVALVTTDVGNTPAAIVERYASRWSIEVAFEEAKQVTGVGDARNRTELAVRRIVPFGLLCQSLMTLWYLTALHGPDVVDERRRQAPWYRSKETPATAGMLQTARRVLIAAQYLPERASAPTPSEIAAVTRAWAQAAA